jgi:hypothetical protein
VQRSYVRSHRLYHRQQSKAPNNLDKGRVIGVAEQVISSLPQVEGKLQNAAGPDTHPVR